MNRWEGFDAPQLRDHHWPGQHGYGRNFAAPHSHHFLEWLDWQRERIADTALSLDHARCTRIDLQFAPQPQDLDGDAPVEDIFVNSRRLQQVRARERPLRCFEKGEQQGILTFTQPDRRLIAVYESSAATIKPPAIESVSAALRITSAYSSPHFLSPQYGADACKQFSETEWFYDAVVPTPLAAHHPTNFVGALTGRDDYGDVRVRADLAQQVEPVLLAETTIENHQIRLTFGEVTRHLLTPSCRDGAHVVLIELVDDHLPQHGIVVDNQDAPRVATFVALCPVRSIERQALVSAASGHRS